MRTLINQCIDIAAYNLLANGKQPTTLKLDQRTYHEFMAELSVVANRTGNISEHILTNIYAYGALKLEIKPVSKAYPSLLIEIF
jgi:hypothetical protein